MQNANVKRKFIFKYKYIDSLIYILIFKSLSLQITSYIYAFSDLLFKCLIISLNTIFYEVNLCNFTYFRLKILHKARFTLFISANNARLMN